MTVSKGYTTSFEPDDAGPKQDGDSLHALGAVPDYPTNVLPAAARSLVKAGAADGLPRALVAGAALAAMTAAVGAGAQLEVNPRFCVRAILWIPLLAPAGAGKSPAQGLAFRPIRAHDAQLDDHGIPVLNGDMTLESLFRILHKSDGTAALDVDELATFVRGIGEYKRNSGDRGRVLGMWTGDPIRYTRVGSRGTNANGIDLRIPRPTVVICGGLQTKHHDLLGGESDGMRPRWLPHLTQMPKVGNLPQNGGHPADWQSLLAGGLLPIRSDRRTWKLSGPGLKTFNDQRERWKKQAREEPESVAGALNKADTHLARIALVFAEADAPGRGGEVPADVVERAATVVDFTLDCWRALPEQGSLALSYRDAKLDVGVERLAAWVEERGGQASRRDIQRAHVAGARTANEVDALIGRYRDTYPGRVTEIERGGNASVEILAPLRRTREPTVSPLATPIRTRGANPHEHDESACVPTGDTLSGDTSWGDIFYAPEARCSHHALWLARDGIHRCFVCDPPAFPSEIVAGPPEQYPARRQASSR